MEVTVTETITPVKPASVAKSEAPRPSYIPIEPPDLDNIPASLKKYRRWVVWNYEWSNDREDFAKMPYHPVRCGERYRATRHKADHPEEATSFKNAVATMNSLNRMHGANGQPNRWGIGFSIAESDGITGLDWDKCHDPVVGVSDPAVQEEVHRLDSYTEISPSGHGLRMFVFGKKPGIRCRKKGHPVEIYDHGRFLSITGNRVEGTPADVMPRQEQLESYYRELFGDEPERSSSSRSSSSSKPIDPELAALGITPDNDCFPEYRPKLIPPMEFSDQEILTRAFAARNGSNVRRLWEGDTSDYDSDDSRADAALASMLAFWVGPDPNRLWSLMCQSALHRPKWKREDYRRDTLTLALDGRHEFHRSVRPQYEPEAGAFEPEDLSDPFSEAELEGMRKVVEGLAEERKLREEEEAQRDEKAAAAAAANPTPQQLLERLLTQEEKLLEKHLKSLGNSRCPGCGHPLAMFNVTVRILSVYTMCGSHASCDFCWNIHCMDHLAHLGTKFITMAEPVIYFGQGPLSHRQRLADRIRRSGKKHKPVPTEYAQFLLDCGELATFSNVPAKGLQPMSVALAVLVLRDIIQNWERILPFKQHRFWASKGWRMGKPKPQGYIPFPRTPWHNHTDLDLFCDSTDGGLTCGAPFQMPTNGWRPGAPEAVFVRLAQRYQQPGICPGVIRYLADWYDYWELLGQPATMPGCDLSKPPPSISWSGKATAGGMATGPPVP